MSLVTCSVALYPATSEADTVRFNLINPETNNRIKMQTLDAGTGETVSRSDLVKGYQIAKGEYHPRPRGLRERQARVHAHLGHREVRGEGVDQQAVLGRALSPGTGRQDGRRGLRSDPRGDAQDQHGGVGPPGDEHAGICALEVEEDAMLMTTLRTAEEVRAIDAIEPPQLPKADPRMLDIATKIIEQQAGEFDPSEFKDRYEDSLRALIEEKRKGMPVRTQATPAADTKVVDLIDALKRGLQTTGRGVEEPTRRPRAASKAAAARGQHEHAATFASIVGSI
jgi:DNA end-binding protein Ku